MFYNSVGLEGLLHKDYVYHEREKKIRDNKKFILFKDKFNSYRLIAKDSLGNWIGGLQIVTNETSVIVSNIYVDPNHRRKGVSIDMLKYAIKIFPNMEFSTNRNDMSNGMVDKFNKLIK